MCKRVLMSLVVSLYCLFAVMHLFAYNPPVAGERLGQLTGAAALVSASSAAGGGIFYADSHSTNFNPALTAFEQRYALNLGFDVLVSGEQKKLGGAFQAGLLFPSKYLIGTVEMRGQFSELDKMYFGNMLEATGGISKSVTDRLSMGMSLNAGAFWGAKSSWTLAVGFGTVYRIPSAGFLRDIRIGASLLHLGKPYSGTTLRGIDGSKAGWFPGLGTLRVGAAALFVQIKNFELGLSLDLSLPSFQNFVTDLGIEMSISRIVYIALSETINAREIHEGHYDFLPTITIGARFVLKSGRSKYMSSHGWQESDMRVDAGYKYLYNDIHAISASSTVKLGMQDKDPPVIELWGGK